MFFSPRLIASRINMLSRPFDPRFYTDTPKEVRMMYWKDMAKFVAFGSSVIALAYLAGADTEVDPRSSDFGKIKIKDTRIDIWGGFQPYVRLIAQLISGQVKSTHSVEIKELGNRFGEEDRLSVLSRFVRGKLAPVPASIVDAISKTNLIGEEVTPAKLLVRSLLPLIVNDISDAMHDNPPGAAIAFGGFSVLGVGIQSYPTTGWWKDQIISYKGEKTNALGETTETVNENLWGFLEQHNIRVAPPNKSTLRTYDEKDNKLIKYTDKQYFDYVQERGFYLKNELTGLANMTESGEILARLMNIKKTDGTLLFKTKEEAQKIVPLIINRTVETLRKVASEFGMAKATGIKNPTKFYMKLRDITGMEGIPMESDSIPKPE
jgi:hypothetical protein